MASSLCPYLASDGVLFGSTILGRGVRHNLLGRRLMRLYNRKGIFSNLEDDQRGLEQGLASQLTTSRSRSSAPLRFSPVGRSEG